MMNAQTCSKMSDRQKVRLHRRMVKRQKKEIKKSINQAIKHGEKVTSIPCYLDCWVNAEVIANVHQTISSWLTSEGFYVRQYELGVPMQHMDYRVSWGDEKDRQKRIDEIHETHWRKEHKINEND